VAIWIVGLFLVVVSGFDDDFEYDFCDFTATNFGHQWLL